MGTCEQQYVYPAVHSGKPANAHVFNPTGVSFDPDHHRVECSNTDEHVSRSQIVADTFWLLGVEKPIGMGEL